MADREGDPSKRPPYCKTADMPTACRNLIDKSPLSMDRETYECEVCGLRFTLHYEDMA